MFKIDYHSHYFMHAYVTSIKKRQIFFRLLMWIETASTSN